MTCQQVTFAFVSVFAGSNFGIFRSLGLETDRQSSVAISLIHDGGNTQNHICQD